MSSIHDSLQPQLLHSPLLLCNFCHIFSSYSITVFSTLLKQQQYIYSYNFLFNCIPRINLCMCTSPASNSTYVSHILLSSLFFFFFIIILACMLDSFISIIYNLYPTIICLFHNNMLIN